MSLNDITSNNEQTPSLQSTNSNSNNFLKLKSDATRNLFKLFTSSIKNKKSSTNKTSQQHQQQQQKRVPLLFNDSKLKNNDYLLIEFTLKRSTNTIDYGFTIVGYLPCSVGRVEHNSIAYKAGLQCTDQIIKIDSDNVSRWTSESIVKRIKNCQLDQLKLTVYRKLQQTTQTNRFGMIQIGKNITQGDNATMGIINSTENDFIMPAQHTTKQESILTTTTITTKQIESFKSEDFIYYAGGAGVSINKNTTTKRQTRRVKESAPRRHHNRRYSHSSNSNRKRSSKIVNLQKLNKTNSSCANSPISSKSSSSSNISVKSEHLPSPIPFLPPIKTLKSELLNSNNKKSTLTDSDYKTQSSSTTDLGSTSNDYQCQRGGIGQLLQEQDDFLLEEFDTDRMDSCEKILHIEEKFIELMQKGVQQYSRPLRHCMMINASQHHILFQNIEKILAISEYQLNQLISQDDSSFMDMFNSIGKLYENKMRMSCEAFDIYLNGVEHAFTLLDNLIRTQNFSKFIQDSQDDIHMDLKTFLLLPLKYIYNVYNCLQLIRDRTKNKINNDYTCINNVLTNLNQYFNKSSTILSKYLGISNTANFNLIELNTQQQQHNNNNNTPTSTSTTTRHIIYSSKLNCRLNCDDTKFSKTYTILFNDILAFMSKKFDENQIEHMNNHFNYIKDYVNLKNIVKYDFDLDNNEFQLISNKNRILNFKALSLEEKHTWKKLLIQRINQSKR